MARPKVSVVIPVWGSYKEFLPQCVESIVNQTFKDYEIIIVEDKTDLPSARNSGIQKAKGEYILPLDVDDWIKPTYLEKTVDKGDIVTTHVELPTTKDHCFRWKIEKEIFPYHNQLIACSLFKKEVWEKIGGYDETMKDGYEDWDFWQRASIAGYEFTVIHEPLYYYNFRETGSMLENTNKIKDSLKEYMRTKNYGPTKTN
jgi:glycosyltransferase involved in cell wall biosynthesis